MAENPFEDEGREFMRDSARVVFWALRVLRDLLLGVALALVGNWSKRLEESHDPGSLLTVGIWVVHAAAVFLIAFLVVTDAIRLVDDWREERRRKELRRSETPPRDSGNGEDDAE